MTTSLEIALNDAVSLDVSIATPGPKGDPSAGYYIAAHDEQDQVNAVADTPNAVKFRSIDESDGIDIVDESKITFEEAGVYNVQFSMQLLKGGGGTSTFDVWFDLNGDPIANTNTRYYIGNNEHKVAALNLVLTVQADDYVRLMWSSPSSSMTLESETGLTNPTRPDIPSVILTVTQVR